MVAHLDVPILQPLGALGPVGSAIQANRLGITDFKNNLLLWSQNAAAPSMNKPQFFGWSDVAPANGRTAHANRSS